MLSINGGAFGYNNESVLSVSRESGSPAGSQKYPPSRYAFRRTWRAGVWLPYYQNRRLGGSYLYGLQPGFSLAAGGGMLVW